MNDLEVADKMSRSHFERLHAPPATSERNGDPMSLRGPEVTAFASTPTFSNSPRALTVNMITPMLPVTEDGCAMTVSAADAI